MTEEEFRYLGSEYNLKYVNFIETCLERPLSSSSSFINVDGYEQHAYIRWLEGLITNDHTSLVVDLYKKQLLLLRVPTII